MKEATPTSTTELGGLSGVQAFDVGQVEVWVLVEVALELLYDGAFIFLSHDFFLCYYSSTDLGSILILGLIVLER